MHAAWLITGCGFGHQLAIKGDSRLCGWKKRKWCRRWKHLCNIIKNIKVKYNSLILCEIQKICNEKNIIIFGICIRKQDSFFSGLPNNQIIYSGGGLIARQLLKNKLYLVDTGNGVTAREQKSKGSIAPLTWNLNPGRSHLRCWNETDTKCGHQRTKIIEPFRMSKSINVFPKVTNIFTTLPISVLL